MKKIYLSDLQIEKKLSENLNSTIYLLKNGNVLKLLKSHNLNYLKMINIDIEQKILNSKKIETFSEILTPIEAIYSEDDRFIGYTMNLLKGMSIDEYFDSFTLEDRTNLFRYAEFYSELEDTIKRANEEGFVFPDLCSFGNIYINNGRFIFPDYDGIQVGIYESPSISSFLGDYTDYFNTKYMTETKLFTPNLDKKSIITLYFLDVFQVGLDIVGQYLPSINQVVTLDYIFDTINLNNDDMKHKVWKIFQNDCENEFLGQTMFDLADETHLRIIKADIDKKIYVKKLDRK